MMVEQSFGGAPKYINKKAYADYSHIEKSPQVLMPVD